MDFIKSNIEKLNNYSKMSKKIGDRGDFVQGGGGNTSVKLDNNLMAIKASGYCLSDIEIDNAYAVLNYKSISEFYYNTDISKLEDVEKIGAQNTKENIQEIEGLPVLRPSVEAGFHSILKTYVIHSHSVYANLACCSVECSDIAEIAFKDAEYSFCVVPYTDPGAKLTFSILNEIQKNEKKSGTIPSVILMQNHGIIVHDDDVDKSIVIHKDANERLANIFKLSIGSFPEVTIVSNGDLYRSTTPYLKEKLQNCKYSYKTFIDSPLYPDQLVFLLGSFYMDRDGDIPEGECVAYTDTGELILNMNLKKAITIAQTIAAVIFIMDNININGYTLSTMGEAAKSFIANWESEKYRKSLA